MVQRDRPAESGYHAQGYGRGQGGISGITNQRDFRSEQGITHLVLPASPCQGQLQTLDIMEKAVKEAMQRSSEKW